MTLCSLKTSCDHSSKKSNLGSTHRLRRFNEMAAVSRSAETSLHAVVQEGILQHVEP